MPTKLSTTLQKLESVRVTNQVILYQYILSKDPKSERHIISLLTLLISLDKFYGIPFTSINSREQILKFLNYRYSQKDGKWIEREHDAEGKYITSFNYYLRLLSVFLDGCSIGINLKKIGKRQHF